MAIIWMDGFNTVGSTYFPQTYIGTTNSASGYSGRYDGTSMQTTDLTGAGSENTRLTYGTHLAINPISALSMGIAFRRVASGSYALGMSSTQPQFMFYNGNTTADSTVNNMIAGVSISSTSTLGPWTVNIMNRSGNLSQAVINNWNPAVDAWNYIEIELQASATVGFVRVYINGILALSTVGANLSTNTGSVAINKVGILPNNQATNIYTQYDDYYITDTTTRLGEMHITTLRPSADTATKQWTPTPSSPTTNWDKVDDTNYNTYGSYVSTNASGRKDLYDMYDLSMITQLTGNIAAVKANGYGYKSTFGTSNVNMIIKSSTTEVNGPGTDLVEGSAAAKPITSILLETDPATSTSWTTASVNAAQIGIRSN